MINNKIISMSWELIKNNEAVKTQKIVKELRDKRSEVLNKPIDPELEKDFRRICTIYGKDACIYDPLLQQAYQDYVNAYHKKASLYTIVDDNYRTNLIIYDTENQTEELKIIETPEPLNLFTCIAQLPNGNLFCFGNGSCSGISLIIDENSRVRQLPSGTQCYSSSTIYFDHNIYCFGGYNECGEALTLSERFDLNENRWIKLSPLPQHDYWCHSIIFNRNILISGWNNKNVLIYSIDIESFSTIPYDFEAYKIKILINSERMYLTEINGSVYESEVSNEFVWRRISKSIINFSLYQVYLTYNKGEINIAGISGDTKICRYKFNLNQKSFIELP
ncbi:unnamed protein product [Blepharisma stoltei]|uniref:Uncharacterized protein n=1 Tax=Blepharisma stoltei TaxID=1481888 RepID=A0AAU9ISZ0_9CILI|nr:unnamed protein product [Blepharisma stoltei]